MAGRCWLFTCCRSHGLGQLDVCIRVVDGSTVGMGHCDGAEYY